MRGTLFLYGQPQTGRREYRSVAAAVRRENEPVGRDKGEMIGEQF